MATNALVGRSQVPSFLYEVYDPVAEISGPFVHITSKM